MNTSVVFLLLLESFFMLLATLTGTPVEAFPDPAHPMNNGEYVATSGEFILNWKIDDSEYLQLKMSAKTTGWLSVGISFEPRMSNSDIYTGWVDDSNGKVVLLDSYATDLSMPLADTERGGTHDVKLMSASQDSEWTSIAFKRKLVTGDSNDTDIVNDKQYLLWAYSLSDGNSDRSYNKHSAVGIIRINFFSAFQEIDSAVLNAGVVLVAFVGLLFLTWVVVRFSRKACKWYINRKAAEEDTEMNNPVSQPYPSPKAVVKRQIPPRTSISFSQPKSSNKPHFNDANSHPNVLSFDNVLPMGRSFYRGSQMFTSPVDSISHLEEIDSQDKKEEKDAVDSHTEDIEEKSAGSHCGNFMTALLLYRIPASDVSLLSAAVGVLYVAINVACLFAVSVDLPSGVGYLAAANALLVAIPSTRNSLLSFLLGISFDRTIMYHRWLGRFTVFVVLVHGGWQTVIWFLDGNSEYLQTKTVFGVCAGGVGIIILITSLERIRRKKFEIFFYSHFSFIAFYVFAGLHSEQVLPYVYAAAAVYGLDRLLRTCWGLVFRRTTLLHCKDPTENIIQMRFPKHPLASMLGMYKVGQYVFVNFPGLSWLEWHPFSLSNGPDEKTLEIHVKGVGDHTAKIAHWAKNRTFLWVRVDGPYGNQNINYRRFPVLIIISGGIGITPSIGILKDMYRVGRIDPNQPAPLHCVEQVYFIWTIQNTSQYEWFGPEILSCWEASCAKLGMPKLNVQIYVTQPQSEQTNPTFFAGRPDFELIFGESVQNFPTKAATVFVCGPKSMVAECWDVSNKLSRQGHKFHFHHESFEL